MIGGRIARGGLIALAFAGGSTLAGCALRHQNHMNDALASLNVAAAALGQAKPDAAGHVAAALKDTRAAISAVEAGMSYKIQTGQQPNPPA